MITVLFSLYLSRKYCTLQTQNNKQKYGAVAIIFHFSNYNVKVI